MPPKHEAALVIAGHGSTVNPDSSAPTRAIADAIRKRALFAEVQCAFWKEEPSFRQVLYTIESPTVYVVPNFISEGYFTQTVIPRELELDGAVTRQADKTIFYCPPAGNHPRMTDLLLQRARETAPGVPPGQTSLIIAGHGTGLNDNSAAAARREAKRISNRGGYAETLCAFMQEPPFLSEWEKLTTAPNVIVVPFFIADGLHSYQDIPVLLGIENDPGDPASRRDVFRNNPYARRGRNLFYASAIGADPRFADIILDQVEAFEGGATGP